MEEEIRGTTRMTHAMLLDLIRSLPGGDSHRGDEELLARFAVQHDEAAFEEILKRHGPMVLAVCLRVLGKTTDADDAFQATFLVLVRRAADLRRPELLPSWLCAVAYRVARQALRRRLRTAAHERQVDRLPESVYDPVPPHDWVPLFDAALQRLPCKFREPLILCDLRGWSRARAARMLGLNENTLSSRLARGRMLLRRRLGHVGFPLAAGALLAPVAVPKGLANAALRHAAAFGSGQIVSDSILGLAERVIGMMVSSWKLKAAGLVFALALLAAGIGIRGIGPAIEAAPPVGPLATQNEQRELSRADEEQLQGTWKVMSISGNGPPNDESNRDPPRIWEFSGDRCRVCIGNFGGGVIKLKDGSFIPGWDTYAASFSLQSNKVPKCIDIIEPGLPNKKLRCGIYELTEDKLTLWFGPDGDPAHRPAEFRFPAQGADYSVVMLERQKAKPDKTKTTPNPTNGPTESRDGVLVPSNRTMIELELRREIAGLRKRLDDLERRVSDWKR